MLFFTKPSAKTQAETGFIKDAVWKVSGWDEKLVDLVDL